MRTDPKMWSLQMRYVEQNGPRFDVLAPGFDVVEVNRVEHQRQRLEEHENCHQVVDTENGVTEKVSMVYIRFISMPVFNRLLTCSSSA